MKPVDFKEANITLMPARGDEDVVDPIRAIKDTIDMYDGRAITRFRTVYEPSPRELETLYAGGYLIIATLGDVFPPVALEVIQPNSITVEGIE